MEEFSKLKKDKRLLYEILFPGNQEVMCSGMTGTLRHDQALFSLLFFSILVRTLTMRSTLLTKNFKCAIPYC